MRKSEFLSLHDNLKESEESKAGEFNASKGWFDNFGKRIDLHVSS